MHGKAAQEILAHPCFAEAHRAIPAQVESSDLIAIMPRAFTAYLAPRFDLEAEAAGYVRLGPKGGRPLEIMPTLRDAYDHFLADVQAEQDEIARMAFAKLA